MQEAVVKERDGTELVTTEARLWRTQAGRSTSGGQAYDHKAILGPETAEFLVGKQNRTLTIGTVVYNVVNAFVWADLDYVEADVRLVASNG